jgi:hypothetical protein
MRGQPRNLAGIVLGLLTLLCGSCSYLHASYDVTFRVVDAQSGAPFDGAVVELQLFRDGEPLGLGGFVPARPIGGDEVGAYVVVDSAAPSCVLLIFCDSPDETELGDPPDEARVNVRDGPRTGSASVPIAAEDVRIEDQYFGYINLGAVAITFEAQP